VSDAAARPTSARARLALPLPLCVALQTALNALIARDPEAQRRLRALDGKLVEIRLDTLDMAGYCFCHADGIDVHGRHDGEVDATILGKPFSLASMAFSRQALFDGDVRLLGDADVAKRFHRLLTQIDVDWEEQLSQVVGDIAAHQLGSLARNAADWFNRAADSLRRDSAEYSQEEATHLPARCEMDDWLSGVDQLREGADRLAARLDQLERQRGSQARS
jgi:ubiquinone biosynthesis protein UbiJ